MLLYPKTIEPKLGFDKVKSLLAEACHGQLGKNQVDRVTLHHDVNSINELLNATDELLQQLKSGDPFPELQAFELAQELKRSAVQGYHIPGQQLFQLKQNLQLMSQIARYFEKCRADYPNWHNRCDDIAPQKELLENLDRVFDRNGGIKDSASQSLKKIRQEIRLKESSARRELESILKTATEKGYTEKDSGLTIRDGRLVVPIQAEHKRRFKGLIVDESTTGKTVYLEPLQVFDQNNQIRELHFAEKREIIAILTTLTLQVAKQREQLMDLEAFLGEVDFTRAKAKLAQRIDACKPQVRDQSDFNLIDAVHPILLLANRKLNLPVVPLSAEINEDQRIIVISGPNAGGKSVALKTVGLLQMMLQSGMLVPVADESTMGIFKELFIDIGDEQSIENDLSTYSSHLENMRHLLLTCTERSLFLIDEFGTGTEPQFGGAIAESIMEILVARKARGLVTTHYGNLKKFAEEQPFVINAAMRFDLERLAPLYLLDIGKPGSSFALEIAGKIGLPSEVLSAAKARVGHDQVAFEKLVTELEQEKQKYDQYNQQVEDLKNKLEASTLEKEKQISQIQGERKEIINRAKMEAQELLTEANQRIEATIRAIQENKAKKEVTRQVRQELDRFKESSKPLKITKEVGEKVLPGPIRPGDMVRLKDSEAKGEVVSISGKSAEIIMGALKSKVKLHRLQKVGTVQPQSRPAPAKVKSNIELHSKRANYSSQLDVRGMRASEALKAVADFIDESMLLGMTHLRILHGKGDGILRSVIREQLSGDPSIESMKDEHVERGGSGITLVTLK